MLDRTKIHSFMGQILLVRRPRFLIYILILESSHFLRAHVCGQNKESKLAYRYIFYIIQRKYIMICCTVVHIVQSTCFNEHPINRLITNTQPTFCTRSHIESATNYYCFEYKSISYSCVSPSRSLVRTHNRKLYISYLIFGV